jgi:hypothetical protein
MPSQPRRAADAVAGVGVGLKDLDPDMVRVLLDHLFGPKYIQVVVVRNGNNGNDGRDYGEAHGAEPGKVDTLYVPLLNDGPERWLVDYFPSHSATDGTTLFVDVEYLQDQHYLEYYTLQPGFDVDLPSEEVLGLDLASNGSGPVPRNKHSRWSAWAYRLLDPAHQKRAGILKRMPPFYRIVRVVVVKLRYDPDDRRG